MADNDLMEIFGHLDLVNRQREEITYLRTILDAIDAKCQSRPIDAALIVEVNDIRISQLKEQLDSMMRERDLVVSTFAYQKRKIDRLQDLSGVLRQMMIDQITHVPLGARAEIIDNMVAARLVDEKRDAPR